MQLKGGLVFKVDTLSRFPEDCNGYICDECDPYGCPFTSGEKDLQGNIIEDPRLEIIQD